MKRIAFSRKTILRAIHAACVALFLAASGAAHAQTATGSNGNVTISGTGNTSFVLGPTSTPPLNSGGTLTISPGTSVSVSGNSAFSAAYAIQVTTPSTTTNSGSLSASNLNNFSGGPAVTLDITPLTMAGNVTIQNNNAGTITASSYLGSATAIDVENVQAGSVSITNSGHITTAAALIGSSPGQGQNFTDIFANDTSATGSISLTNTGMITTTGSTAVAYGANLSTGGSGGISVTNSGTVSVGASEGEGNISAGLDLTSSGSGNITVNNSGTASGSGYVSSLAVGIDASATGDGAISITNTGTVSGSNMGGGSGIGIDAITAGSGNITITNSGPVTGTAIGTASGIYASASGTGNIIITNNAGGTIVANSTGGPGYGLGAIAAAGTAQVTNAATIGSSSSAADFGLDVAGTTVSITNTGAIGVGSGGGSAFAISGASSSGTLSIANSAALTANSLSGSAYDIIALGAGDTTIQNTGSATLTATATVYYGNAYGILASNSAGTITVTNQQAMSISGYHGAAGINAAATADLTITNSGALTVQNAEFGSSGITGSSASGSVSIANASTGTISSTSTYGTAYGLNAQTTGGSIQIGNAAAIHATSTNSTAYAIYTYTHTGTGTVTNTGALTSSGGTNAYGIYAQSNIGDTPNYNITNSAAIHATTTASSGYFNADGIFIHSGLNVQLTNQGAITVSGTGSHDYAYDLAAHGNNVSVFNSAPLQATSSGGGSYGIYATAATSLSVSNTQAISAISSSGYSNGILAIDVNGDVTVTNSGAVTASGGTTSYGINAKSTSASVQVENTAAIHATSTGGTASAIYLYTPTGTGMVTNTGALITTGSTAVYGINAHTVQGNSQSYTITNSAAIQVSSTASSGFMSSDGIFGNGQNVQITNSGAITTSGSHIYANAILGSGETVSISNTGVLNATSGDDGSYGMFATASALLTVGNTQTITATSTSGYAYGIYGRGGGEMDLTNSGSLTIRGGAASAGIAGISFGSNVSLINSGQITATASAYSVSGLYAKATSGNIAVTNSGHVSATSQSGAYTASGIYAQAGTGTTTVSNSGYAGGFNTNGGLGYGIDVDPTGPIVVNNTGTAIGTTAGIFLTNAGTVNNYGLASGGTYSIQVPTASTVNLDGASPVHGLLKGGADDTSTSQLNFNLAISGNHLAASEAALNAAIAQYDAAYTTANGNGANVDSEVVTINGIAYQWEDFFGIANNLVQGRLYGATPGYHGIGTAIDNFDPNSARGTAILAALDNLPDSAVANALAQLSPKALQVFRHIAFDGASFTAANVNNHLANLRDGLTGFDTSGFSVNTPGVDPTLTQMRSRLLAFNPAPLDHGLLSDSSSSLFGGMDMKDTKALVNTQPVDPWSAFISGSVVLANLDNTTSNIGDSDYTTGSVMAGVDYRLTDNFTVGALFNYAHTSANLDGNGSKATVDSYAPGIYASYVDKKGWYGNAMLMYGFNDNTDDRNITIPGIQGVNHGASDGGQVTSNLTGGYEFQRGNFKFGPVASLQYVHLTVGSFQEQGPTSLSIDRQEADSLRTQLGLEVRYSAHVPTCYGPLELTPHFQASWQHEYMDNSDGISSEFNGGAGGGSFVVQGQQPERDSAFLDLGVDAQVAKNVTLFIDYQTQAGQNDFFAQSAQGGVRIGF